MARARKVQAAAPVPQDDSIGYGPHWGQKLFHASTARTRVLACGRRWGKDRACIMEMLVFLVNLRDARIASLTPVQLRQFVPLVSAWVVAPTYQLTKQHWDEFLNFIPRDLIAAVNAQDHRLQLCDGDIVIDFKSEEKPETLVGTGLDMVLVTESGIISDRAWDESIQPTLLSPGRAGHALINGTPKGQRGFLWRLFQLGQKPEHASRVQSWNFTCYDNPLLSPAQVEEIAFLRETTPEHTFRQEYLAEFIPDGAFFRNVAACTRDDRGAPYAPLDGPEAGHAYLLGLDLARRQDFSAACVLDISVQPHRQVYLDRWNKLDWDFQIARIAAIIARWHIRNAAVDQTGVGDMPVQTLQRHFRPQGIEITGVLFTGFSKNPMIEGLALAFEQRLVGLLPDEQQLRELNSYRAVSLASGAVRYTAPPGMTDDLVIALALAWYAATEGLPRARPVAIAAPRTIARVSPWRGEAAVGAHAPRPDDDGEGEIYDPVRRIAGHGVRVGPRARRGW